MAILTDDDRQAAITRAAGQAIGAWLAARGGLERPVGALTPRELEAMASAAIAAAILRRADLGPCAGGPAGMGPWLG